MPRTRPRALGLAPAPAAARRRGRGEVTIDLDSDGGEQECKSKCSRTSRRTAIKVSDNSTKLPSFYDDVPKEGKRSSTRVVGSSKGKASNKKAKPNNDKLNTDIFELYLEDLWKHIDEDKKSAYTYFDSLWFHMYNGGHDKSNVLKWIKAKKIFSRQYVFVPIVCWGHWNLLVLCNFGEANPRMLLLDSLKTINPARMRLGIKRFIADIVRNEEQEIEKFKNIHIEFPEVPQQNGDECGIYVLYFIHYFLQNRKLGEDLSQLDGMFDPEGLDNFFKDFHSFQANRSARSAE